jgi:hypothetical protein
MSVGPGPDLLDKPWGKERDIPKTEQREQTGHPGYKVALVILMLLI